MTNCWRREDLVIAEPHMNARVVYNSIIYIENRYRETVIVTEKGRIGLKYRLQEAADQLSRAAGKRFCSAGVSYIINFDHVNYMSDGTLYMSNGEEISFCKNMYLKVRKCYREYIMAADC